MTFEDFRYYSEFNAIFDDFEAGAFAEVVFWWDWTSDVGTTGNRDVCVGVGYTLEEIAFTLTTENFINNCYKTIISNLVDPGAAFKEEELWTECEQSTSVTPPLFEYSWFDTTADQEKYWYGVDANKDDADAICAGGGNLFATNPVAGALFDIALEKFYDPKLVGRPAPEKKLHRGKK